MSFCCVAPLHHRSVWCLLQDSPILCKLLLFRGITLFKILRAYFWDFLQSFIMFSCLDVIWMFDYTKAMMVKDLLAALIADTHPSIKIAASEVFVRFV